MRAENRRVHDFEAEFVPTQIIDSSGKPSDDDERAPPPPRAAEVCGVQRTSRSVANLADHEMGCTVGARPFERDEAPPSTPSSG